MRFLGPLDISWRVDRKFRRVKHSELNIYNFVNIKLEGQRNFTF